MYTHLVCLISLVHYIWDAKLFTLDIMLQAVIDQYSSDFLEIKNHWYLQAILLSFVPQLREIMEDLAHLTINLFLTEEDNAGSTKGDNDCNSMLAGLLDLGQTCLKVSFFGIQRIASTVF